MRREIYLRELERSIAILEDALPNSFDEFEKLPQIVKDGIFKRTEHAIELLFDIMADIIREKNLETPSDDYDIVEVLRRHNILSEEEAKKLRAMRGFRNVLVHMYEDLREEEAFDNIRSGIHDLKYFLGKFRKV